MLAIVGGIIIGVIALVVIADIALAILQAAYDGK